MKFSRSLMKFISMFVIVNILWSLFPTQGVPIVMQAGDDVRVVVSDPSTIKLLKERGAVMLADYGGYSLWQVASDKIGHLRRATSLTVEDNIIKLRDLSVDTTKEDQPLPANLKIARTDDYQIWMVQMIGPIKNEWLDVLRDANIRLIYAIGTNSFVVWVNGEQIERIEAMIRAGSFMRWAGAFHPAYRMDKWVQEDLNSPHAEDATVKVNVQFYNSPTVKESWAKLLALGGKPLEGSLSTTWVFSYVALELPLKELVNIAHWPDVFDITAWDSLVAFDESQDQIIAGNVTTMGPIVPILPGSPGYRSYRQWLADNNFPTTANAYPPVAVIDSGNGTGTPENPLHPDFRNASGQSRIIATINCTNDIDARDDTGHGTLAASIVGGLNVTTTMPYPTDSNGFNLGIGVAPYGNLIITKIMRLPRVSGGEVTFDVSNCNGGGNLINDYEEMLRRTYNAGARITSNSWGGGGRTANSYTILSQLYDRATRDARTDLSFQPMLHIFAAGNFGNNGFRTIAAPSTAKNVITVGATEGVREDNVADGCNWTAAGNAANMTTFSSRGPTADGRIKPDMSAPGSHIQGAASQSETFDGKSVCGGFYNSGDHRYHPFSSPEQQTLYTWAIGTSFSAPAVAGAAALATNYYNRVLGASQVPTLINPSPAMVKALLLNSSSYLKGVGANDTLPSPSQGWGTAKLNNLMDGSRYILHDQATVLTTNSQSFVKIGQVFDPTKPLKVSLVWSDAPGVPGGIVSQNNLDLEVTLNGKIYKGNVFNGQFSVAGGVADALNNVESVFLPAGTTGTFSVRVIAKTLRADAVTYDPANLNRPVKQDFALVVYNARTVATTMPIIGQADFLTNDASPDGNGNGSIDRNETIALTIPLVNNGDANATQVDSLLLVSNTNTTANNRASTYPNLLPNLIAAPLGIPNSMPYSFTISPSLSCGTSLSFGQIVTYTAAGNVRSLTIPFTLATGEPILGTAVTTNANITQPIPIPDYGDNEPGMLSVPLNISGAGTVGKIKVKLSVTHDYADDLVIILFSPNGQAITLSQRRGDGAGFVNTTFDDDASIVISDPSASSPFTGSYRPEQPLAEFNGGPIAGTWRLVINDEAYQGTGSLVSWSLEIQPSGYTCAPYSPPAANIVVLAGSNQSAAVTTAFTNRLQAIVTSAGGIPVSGALVTFTAPIAGQPSGVFPNTTNIATATTDANGIATASIFSANTQTGAYRVSAKVGNVSSLAQFDLTNTAGSPASIQAASGSGQVQIVGQAFSVPLRAIVKDGYGNLVNGASVTFMAPPTEPSGTFPANARTNTVATNSSGSATALTFTAGNLIGTYIVRASVAGVANLANFNLGNVAGPPASLIVVAGSQQGTVVSTTFATKLSMRVQDQFGNAVANTSVTFKAPVSGASGTFTNGSVNYTVVSDVNGYAEASDFRANAIAGQYNVTLAVSGATSSASFQLTNLVACGANAPALVVTSITDNGVDTDCGKLTRALMQARNNTITFALTAGNTISVTGKLPPVQPDVILDGGSCQNGSPIILDGTSTRGSAGITNGLELNGGVVIRHLKIINFKNQQVVAKVGGNNQIICTVIKSDE